MKRLMFGRLALYLEPRDAWIGCYFASNAVYVCPLPFCVIRWTRSVADAPAIHDDPYASEGVDDD